MSSTSIRILSPEKDLINFITKLSFLENDGKFNAIVKSIGIASLSDLTIKNQSVSKGSFADSIGSTTIESFITDNICGLGLDWNDWVNMVKSHEIRTRYSIINNNDSDVISQFKDVCGFIGREPIDAEEYHRERDNLAVAAKNKIIADRDYVKSTLQKEIDSLKEANSRESSEKELVQKKLIDLEVIKSTEIKNLNKTIAQKEIEHKLELEQKLSEQETEINAKYSSYYASQTRDLEGQIADLSSRNERLDNELKETVSRHKIEIEEMISRHNIEIENVKNEFILRINNDYTPNTQVSAIQIKLNEESQKSIELMSDQIALTSKLEDQIENNQILRDTVFSLETRYAELTNKILSGSIDISDLDENEIFKLNRKLKEYEYIISKFKAIADGQKEILERKQSVLRQRNTEIKKNKKEIESLEIDNSKSKGKFKKAIYIVGALAASNIILLAWNLM